MALSWAKRYTLHRCDRHGWVAASFGEASPEHRFIKSGYYINYCCGFTGSKEEPESIYDQFMRELEEKKLKVMAKVGPFPSPRLREKGFTDHCYCNRGLILGKDWKKYCPVHGYDYGGPKK